MTDWPGCMTPDGGEVCAEYSELHGKYHRLRARADEMEAALDAWLLWEADLILNGDWSSGTLRLTQRQQDALTPLQEQRNTVLARYRGEGT